MNDMSNNPEVLRDETHNNAIREALIELYKLQGEHYGTYENELLKEAVTQIEKLLKK